MAPQPGDVILNELLFNASEDNAEFIEIWNTSDKTILLSDLLVVKYQSGAAAESVPLSEEDFLLLPKSIVTISENPKAVCEHYHCGKPRSYFKHENLPSLPNDDGDIGLSTRAMQELERVHYNEDWHHPSISNAQNASLERIHPNLPAESSNSWHSASSSSGYGTPGQMNSQFRSTASSQDQIWLASKTISPNNDGLNDVLIIHYELPDWMPSVNARTYSQLNGNLKLPPLLTTNELSSHLQVILARGMAPD